MLRDWLGKILWWRAAAPGIGAMGEAAAAEFLGRKNGFRVVARNWRHRRDEIDLVCRDGAVLVFVEVKTRAVRALVGGFVAIDKRKKRALRRAIRAYLGQLRAKPHTFRFDVVEVRHEEGRATEILHFENIPLFPKNYHFEE